MRCWESASSQSVRLREGKAGHRVRVRVVGVGPGLTQGRHARHRKEGKLAKTTTNNGDDDNDDNRRR
jgi:hypothetical protein